MDSNQVLHPATDESHELYPTCIQRTFQDNSRVVTVRDASSYLSGSPQQDVAKASYATAAGRVIARTTWHGGTALEHATLAYDKLGRLTGMTRYQDPGGVTKPVTWSWHHDSLGQLLELDEPDSSPRTNTYSKWGELLTSSRFTLPASSDDPPNGPVGGPPGVPPNDPIALSVVAQYDALGRVIHKEEKRDGVTDPQTVNDYFYDDRVNITTQVTPTNTRGRLTQASWPTGSVSYSYDAAGDINAQVFLDPQGRTYVEKRNFNDDGTLNTLDMFPPDAAGGQMEEAVYGYDSAGHGNSVIYKTGDHLQNSKTLYSASQIDPFGRVRAATYGLTSFAASYSDVGRRLISQVTASSMAGSRQISFQGFDPMERERSRTETKNSTDSNTTTYTYDALGRLSSSVKAGGTESPFNQQFTYDPLGNLLSQRDTSGATDAVNATLSYLGDDHDRDRICRISYGSDSDTACNVTYDEVGSIASMPTPSGTRQFDYFVDGSIRSIEDAHAGADFRYDAFGEVQELDVRMGAPPFIPDGRHDRHYGDLFTWHDETTGSLTVPVLLRKIPGPDGFLATRHGAGGPWVFSFGEERGTRFLTDDGGTFVQDVNYRPFGKPSSTGAQPGSPLYSNEQWNYGDYLAAFGISKLGARLYDPAVGRFLSRDPLLIPRTATTTNPYAFADNDPINESDPSGQVTNEGEKTCEMEGVPCSASANNDNANKGSSDGGVVYSSAPLMPDPGTFGVPVQCDFCAGWNHGSSGGGGGDGSGHGSIRGGGSSNGSSSQGAASNGTGSFVDPWAQPEPPRPTAAEIYAWNLGGPLSHHYPNLVAEAIDYIVSEISDSAADLAAKTANGIYDLQGGQHPSHAEAVAQFRPGIQAAVDFSLDVAIFLVLSVWALEAEVGSSARLARNLEAAGFTRPAGSAAHHIVAKLKDLAEPARAILRRFFIPIDSAANGVFLPIAAHQSLHTTAYYLFVNALLGDATTRQRVLDALDAIRQALLSGETF